jgi:hypothetical protein
MLVIEFNGGTDMNNATIDIREKIGIRQKLRR